MVPKPLYQLQIMIGSKEMSYIKAIHIDLHLRHFLAFKSVFKRKRDYGASRLLERYMEKIHSTIMIYSYT